MIQLQSDMQKDIDKQVYLLRSPTSRSIADEESAARERDTVIANLRSLLDRCNQQLNVMEQSVGTIEEDRTRI